MSWSQTSLNKKSLSAVQKVLTSQPHSLLELIPWGSRWLLVWQHGHLPVTPDVPHQGNYLAAGGRALNLESPHHNTNTFTHRSTYFFNSMQSNKIWFYTCELAKHAQVKMCKGQFGSCLEVKILQGICAFCRFVFIIMLFGFCLRGWLVTPAHFYLQIQFILQDARFITRKIIHSSFHSGSPITFKEKQDEHCSSFAILVYFMPTDFQCLISVVFWFALVFFF